MSALRTPTCGKKVANWNDSAQMAARKGGHLCAPSKVEGL